jgi:mannose-6-phosphate isomerase-like protein (cupin superfamily)
MGGAGRLVAPDGTTVDIVDGDPPLTLPPVQQSFVLERASDDAGWTLGRAGMRYRDLIPDRMGGRFIASHIEIPTAGPVSDYVHFHKIRFQMIFCRKGWVRLVYEDQCEPFILSAGDCVLQPPRIRHRVLESSPGLEVVEIGCPALHETLADHAMDLPTGRFLPDRDYGGQLFLRHICAETPWLAVDGQGFEARDTGMATATHGLTDARVLRPAGADGFCARPHAGEFLFGFLLEGSATLIHDGEHPLGPADSFVIPAHSPWEIRDATADLELLQVTLPASAAAI